MLKVNVIMITYGHEKYIEQAILGVLMQEGDFDLELIIANDCSPDRTNEFIEKIISTHPKAGLIKYIKREKNFGVMLNFIEACSHCSGNYIAFCEGDDYWVDKFKIKKQLELFLSNPSIGLVHTGVKHYFHQLNQFSEDIINYESIQKEVVPSLLKAKFIDFCTVMIEAELFKKTLAVLNDELLNNAIVGDTRIILECAYKSEVGFVKDVTTVYRIIENSASHPTSVNNFMLTIKDTYNCRKLFVNRYSIDKKMLGVALCNYNKGIISKAYDQKEYANVLKLISKINLKDYFYYCDCNTFFKKTTLKICLKLILSLFGIKVIKNALRL